MTGKYDPGDPPRVNLMERPIRADEVRNHLNWPEAAVVVAVLAAITLVILALILH